MERTPSSGLAIRRKFLQTVASVTTLSIVSPHVLGGPRHVAPSDSVNVALVGAAVVVWKMRANC